MMTAITINLLAEEQQAQQQRAQDPFKVVLACAIGVVALFVGWGGAMLMLASQERVKLASLEARWEHLGGASQESEFQKAKVAADELTSLNRSRFLCAPQLALLKDLIPSTIQLTQLSFATMVEAAAEEPAETEGESKRPSRPKRVERVVLRLTGRATANRPELEVDRFLQTLRTDPQFSTLIHDIQLRSIARAVIEAESGGVAGAGADFVLECYYKERP